MLCADAGVEPVVLSAAAGRMRVHAIGFRHNEAWAAAIEETVAEVTGVRAVQAYPRTESVVVWYAPGDCDTAAVLSAIASVQDVPAASAGTRISHSPVARGHSSVLSKIIGGLAQTLLNPHRDAHEAPPEIERLRAALDRIGYLAPATASQAVTGERGQARRNSHPHAVDVAGPAAGVGSGQIDRLRPALVNTVGSGYRSSGRTISSRTGPATHITPCRDGHGAGRAELGRGSRIAAVGHGGRSDRLSAAAGSHSGARRRRRTRRSAAGHRRRTSSRRVPAAESARPRRLVARDGDHCRAGRRPPRRGATPGQGCRHRRSGRQHRRHALRPVGRTGYRCRGPRDCSGRRHDCLVRHAGRRKRVAAARRRHSPIAASHRSPAIPRPIRTTGDPPATNDPPCAPR